MVLNLWQVSVLMERINSLYTASLSMLGSTCIRLLLAESYQDISSRQML